MRTGDWGGALEAFSEVVRQEPEEGDAWANVAAVHMRNRAPEKAYPCLVESTRRNRGVWRVWVGKLNTCIDLDKYDEAMQACTELLGLRKRAPAEKEVPEVEERAVRAIVQGVLRGNEAAGGDAVAADSCARSVQRLGALLAELRRASGAPWIYRLQTEFEARRGRPDLILENLLKEYRALLTIPGWETDDLERPKVCQVVEQIVDLQCSMEDRKEWTKAKYLVRSVGTRIGSKYFDKTKEPKEVEEMHTKLQDIEHKIAS